MIEIRTERLLIRDHVPGDLHAMHALLTDAQVMRWLPGTRSSSPEETARRLDDMLCENGSTNRTKYFFAVTDGASGEYIGEVGYTVLVDVPQGRVVGLGYFLLPRFWGKGIATEAARAAMRHAFEHGAVKVECGCMADNAASEAMMKKMGMRREAVLRRHTWHEGCFRDRVSYGLLLEEWEQIMGESGAGQP